VRTAKRSSGPARYGKLAGALATVAVLIALMVPLMSGGSAGAAGLSVQSRHGHPHPPPPCTTEPYSKGKVCSTTTTSRPGIHVSIRLKIFYLDGVVSWQACGFPPTDIDTSVQLYLNGQRQSQPGGAGTVQPNGCTSDSHTAICLARGTYPATVVDGPYSASNSLVVDSSGCANPVTLGLSGSASGSGSGSGGQSSALAFTGADILAIALAAALLIVVGYVIVRLNRQRRQVR
jgi:hypothetical protein